jgi:hypothetical protein
MYQINKQQNKTLLLFVEQKLKFISNNNKLNGFIVFILHLLFQLVSIYILFFYPISTLFYFTLFLWIIILISNHIFRGCILTKIERYLWQNNDWFGPYYIFCNLNTWSSNKIKNMYICQITFLITLLFIRILFKV